MPAGGPQLRVVTFPVSCWAGGGKSPLFSCFCMHRDCCWQSSCCLGMYRSALSHQSACQACQASLPYSREYCNIRSLRISCLPSCCRQCPRMPRQPGHICCCDSRGFPTLMTSTSRAGQYCKLPTEVHHVTSVDSNFHHKAAAALPTAGHGKAGLCIMVCPACSRCFCEAMHFSFSNFVLHTVTVGLAKSKRRRRVDKGTR